MGFAWSNMFVTPDEDPRTDGGFVGERDTLMGYLRDQRLTLELKCADLDASQLAARAVEPSMMSLLGLVRHIDRWRSRGARPHDRGVRPHNGHADFLRERIDGRIGQ